MNRHSRRRLELQIQRYLAFWAVVRDEAPKVQR